MSYYVADQLARAHQIIDGAPYGLCFIYKYQPG